MGSKEPRLDALDLPVLLEPSVVLQGLVEDLDSLSLAAPDNVTPTNDSASSAMSSPLGCRIMGWPPAAATPVR